MAILTPLEILGALGSAVVTSVAIPPLVLGSLTLAFPDSPGPPVHSEVWGADIPADTRLHLHGDGSFGANDGCNTGSGTWERNGSDYTLTQGAYTQRWCEGMNPWLSHAETATLDGAVLVVFDDTGEHIGTMTRQ
ncbi:hypothetical protein CFAEC_12590 [Corynebacterium faecale]|uniref:META domain-containing protein n=1 Tax=Corynebacterium faecale TaxID=1758466 RepID=UPI0025B5D542|nr:META domain-containing protein [Corynebacterium faecale]WJY93309.1 hypothetical protein CFAEC_12590 [Corynebacterium faecale]